MTTAVFDCVVLLQAAANPEGAAGACLMLVESGQVRLFLSPAILNEARDVLARRELRKTLPRLTDESVDRFLLNLTTFATFMPDVPAAVLLPRDPTASPI